MQALAFVLALCGQLTFDPVDAGITPQLDAWKAQQTNSVWLWGATAIDYDGDGDSDILLTSHNATLPAGVHNSKLFRNDFIPGGTLAFADVTAAAFPSGIDFHENKPHAWDVDNDGDQDLVCGTRGKTFINNGNGTFSHNGQQVRGTERGAVFSDFNTDGQLDFSHIGHDYSTSTKTVCTNTENGLFSVSAAPLSLPDGLPQSVLDRLAASVAANNTTTQHNRWHGPDFQEADFNGDGSQDALIWFEGSYAGDTWMFLCLRQAGVLVDATAPSLLPSEGCRPISAKDANGDGKLDLLITPGGTTKSGLWLQAANGTFSNAANPTIANYLKFAPPYTPHEWWEDFDLDGDPDLAISMLRLGHGKVYENDGAGNFTERLSVTHWDADAMQVRSRAGVRVDFNGDGLTDVLAVGTASHGSTAPVMCYLNTTIEPPPPPPPGVLVVKIDGVTQPAGTTVKIDGVPVPPPSGSADKVIEVEVP